MGIRCSAKLVYGIYFKSGELKSGIISKLSCEDDVYFQEFNYDDILVVYDSEIDGSYKATNVDDMAINTNWETMLREFCITHNIPFKPPHYYLISQMC